MAVVLLTAIGVGGATVLGALGGFIFKDWIAQHARKVDAFASGMMLIAAILGLIEPALKCGGSVITCVGILLGAFGIILCDRYLKSKERDANATVAYMLLIAIAVHNLPEGMAAGVGFGAGKNSMALSVAFEIAIQNVPEGMVIIVPMLHGGMSCGKTFMLALSTAVIEIVGVFVGYYAAGLVNVILAPVLALAAGMMLYVVVAEMLPNACGKDQNGIVCMLGLIGMLMLNGIL